jgi:hypothetical protein
MICKSQWFFFREIGLSISKAKSELVLFSRKHTNLPIYVSLNGRFMPMMPNFRYLGIVFDGKLLWFKKINFLRCGAHPDVMLILYKGLIRSVLEYGCITFDRIVGTHH